MHNGPPSGYAHVILVSFSVCRHIVRVIGIGAEDPSSDASIRGSLFMVQEYLMGGSLKRIVMEQMLDPFSVSGPLQCEWTPSV